MVDAGQLTFHEDDGYIASLLSLWKSPVENHALILMVLAESNIIIVYFFLAQTRWIGIGSIRFVYESIYFYVLKVFLKKINFF
jgi:hypothetical protein